MTRGLPTCGRIEFAIVASGELSEWRGAVDGAVRFPITRSCEVQAWVVRVAGRVTEIVPARELFSGSPGDEYKIVPK